jgi:beta-lactamase class A
VELDLDAAPGTISVYVGRPGAPPAYTRLPDATHYAASTMKVAVLAALHRSGIDLDTEVPVHNVFRSAVGGLFGCTREYDSDGDVWERLGGTATLRWLATRMIVVSGNLATNIIMSHVGLAAVNEVWALAGARHSVTARGIEDVAARDAGVENLVTAADLAALFTAIATGALGPGAGKLRFEERSDENGARRPLPGPWGSELDPVSAGMLDVLLAQERTEDLVAGLPPGTRIAHKNGWVPGIRHGAGIVFPDDAEPYAIAVCTTTSLDDPQACQLIADVSAAAWTARHHAP